MATKEEMLASAAQRKLAKMKHDRELDERLTDESRNGPQIRAREKAAAAAGGSVAKSAPSVALRGPSAAADEMSEQDWRDQHVRNYNRISPPLEGM